LIDLAPATVLLPTRKKGCVVPEFNGKPLAPPINIPCAWNSFSVDLVAGGGRPVGRSVSGTPILAEVLKAMGADKKA